MLRSRPPFVDPVQVDLRYLPNAQDLGADQELFQAGYGVLYLTQAGLTRFIVTGFYEIMSPCK